MYRDFKLPIYPQRSSEMMFSCRGCTPEEYRLDQAILDVHLERLGAGTVLRVGEAKAIFDRAFHKLDPADYSKAAYERDGRVMVPVSYLRLYFGEDLPDDGQGYADLGAICAERGLAFTYDAETGLAIAMPKPGRPITREEDAGFLARMAHAFRDPMMPEPRYNASEATRKVIASSSFSDEYKSFEDKDYINLYSPTILLTRDKAGSKVIYIAHERSLFHDWREVSTVTVLLRSTDGGERYEEIATLENARWATLFEVEGVIYLAGTLIEPQQTVVMARLEPDGSLSSRVLEGPHTDTCPNEMLVHNGRVYLPTYPYLMSAPVGSDLLDSASWTYSNNIREFVTKKWFLRETGAETVENFWPLENNILIGPGGRLQVIMRLEIQPNNGYALLMNLSEDGKQLSFEESTNGLVEMPTTVSKFQVRYDQRSGLYLAMPSYPSIPMPFPSRASAPVAGHRNVLCLAASPDLINWKVIDILLCDREVMNAVSSARAHGFQYVMWDWDGDDLLYVVREAVGYTKDYHDGMFVTLYRLKDYLPLVKERYAAEEFWKNPNRKKSEERAAWLA
ncbi:MAG: hypothetical protein J6D31_06135 [Clostridia bacterium]|nr:hypothetical protein [Clostridia bacterium]